MKGAGSRIRHIRLNPFSPESGGWVDQPLSPMNMPDMENGIIFRHSNVSYSK